MLRGWTVWFLPSVLHESCGPTPILGVHGITTYAQFSMLKKPNSNLVPGFHGSTSRSGPSLRILIINNIWLTQNLVCAFKTYKTGNSTIKFSKYVVMLKYIVKFIANLCLLWNLHPIICNYWMIKRTKKRVSVVTNKNVSIYYDWTSIILRIIYECNCK